MPHIRRAFRWRSVTARFVGPSRELRRKLRLLRRHQLCHLWVRATLPGRRRLPVRLPGAAGLVVV
jgi:hypothetical protein